MNERKIERIQLFLVIAALSVFFSFNHFSVLNAWADQKAFTVNYPPDNKVIEYDVIGFSLRVDLKAVDLIKVNVDRREILSIVPDIEHECFSLILTPGKSKVEIIAMKNNEKVENVLMQVFRRSDLSKRYMKIPDGFKKDAFHMADTSGCAECHKLKPVEYDKKPINPKSFAAQNFDKEKIFASTSTCYSCHKKITSRPYVHGPAAVWSCLSCHETESEQMYAVLKPDTEMCYKCHVEQKEYWSGQKYAHGPVTMGRCTICHSPHSADNAFNLFKSTWLLCTNCHVEKGSGKHVLGDSFSTEGHPTRNRKDPLREGKELSCASCHEPHASNFPHLWAFDVNDLFELCRKCHYDK